MFSRLHRRGFIRRMSAVTAGNFTAPAILGASDKAGNRPPLIGVPGHRYEVHHNCMRVPRHIRWQDTHGIAVDGQGLIYVKHRTKTADPMDAIVVFDATGRFIRSFGKQFHGGGHGIDIREEDGTQYLYLSDNKGFIAKTTLTGEVVWSQGAPDLRAYEGAKPFQVTSPGKYGKGKLFCPTNIAFAPDGGFFVGDGYGSHYVIRYDKNARPQALFGGVGNGKGQLRTPHGLWWDDRPGRTAALAVADRANRRIQYFTVEGTHLSFVEGLLFPADIDIRGEVMLVPDLHARITLLDAQNRVITHLGDDLNWRADVLADNFAMRQQPGRWKPGKFVHPHDACFDQAGNIYVAEWVAVGRVSRLRLVD